MIIHWAFICHVNDNQVDGTDATDEEKLRADSAKTWKIKKYLSVH